MKNKDHSKLTMGGLLVTLGIIFGDIGTSPLYVMKAIIGEGNPIDPFVVMGGVSAVFWTLTLQTTIKYVLITLKADNKGEGGIFSLYTLVRKTFKKYKLLIVPAIIGGAAIIADGMITPPISVTSAVEGLKLVIPDIPVVPIVLIILSVLFFFQRFGTSVVGNFFGPVMFVWFTMLALLGLNYIVQYPQILSALSPHHAVQLLTEYPDGFVFLGAIFLCTTGAEALYSDLGHCGRKNIQVSWIFVKICLVINYLGQSAWMVKNQGQPLTTNPFYSIMPEWFLLPGIIIATMATIIASQALISGSFTLISEAIRLNLYPKVTVRYPSDIKGQMYIPGVNTLLFVGCCCITLYFKSSANMEAAYGLSITIAMMATTVLLSFYLWKKKVHPILVFLVLGVYLFIEIAFLSANLLKFMHGGYVTVIIAGVLILLMWIWLRAHRLKGKLTNFVKIDEYVPQFVKLSDDNRVPYYSTHLVYLSASKNEQTIERNILYSCLQGFPKRAMTYWFVHVEVTDEPYTTEYKVKRFAENDLYKITFRLGFRIEQRISYYLRIVIEEMKERGEVELLQTYHMIEDHDLLGDFRFVMVDDVLAYENDLPIIDKFVLDTYFTIKSMIGSPEKWFGLDPSITEIEKIPLVIQPIEEIKLKRVE